MRDGRGTVREYVLRSIGVDLDGFCALYTLFVLPFSCQSTRKLTIILGLPSIAVLVLFSDGGWIQLIIDDIVIFCLVEVIPYAEKLQRSGVQLRSWALAV